jgi:hypothetical protein
MHCTTAVHIVIPVAVVSTSMCLLTRLIHLSHGTCTVSVIQLAALHSVLCLRLLQWARDTTDAYIRDHLLTYAPVVFVSCPALRAYCTLHAVAAVLWLPYSFTVLWSMLWNAYQWLMLMRQHLPAEAQECSIALHLVASVALEPLHKRV